VLAKSGTVLADVNEVGIQAPYLLWLLISSECIVYYTFHPRDLASAVRQHGSSIDYVDICFVAALCNSGLSLVVFVAIGLATLLWRCSLFRCVTCCCFAQVRRNSFAIRSSEAHGALLCRISEVADIIAFFKLIVMCCLVLYNLMV